MAMRNTDLILETTFIHTDNFVAWYFSVGQGALLTVFDPSSRRLLGKGQAAGSSGQEGGQRSLTLWVSFVLCCGRDRGFPHPRFLVDAGGVTIVLPCVVAQHLGCRDAEQSTGECSKKHKEAPYVVLTKKIINGNSEKEL